MKKILKSLLVVALLLVQLVPMINVSALAGTGTITVQDPIKGKTYTIYEVLTLESYNSNAQAYTYKVADGWNGFFEKDSEDELATGLSYVNIDAQGYVTWKSGADAAAFAQDALAWAKENNIKYVDTKVAGDGDVVFNVSDLGYYLLDSSVGVLCGLNTTNPNTTIKEKNGVPTLEKEVQEDSITDKESWGESNTSAIGETVNYKTTITAQKGAQDYVLYDTMDVGLTFNGITKVELIKSDGTTTELKETTDYIMQSTTNTTYTFIMAFTDTLENTLEDGDMIVVYYSAVVNEKAEIANESNDNKTFLKYGDDTEVNKTPEEITKTYVLSFELEKVDSEDKQLSGATFELYDAEKGGNKIALVYEDGVYRVATAAEKAAEGFVSAIITAGKVTIEGLDADTSYWLEEITPPAGYNKLANRVEVKLTATIENNLIEKVIVNDQVSNLLKVVNTKGVMLPDTGGIGTVLFITIGSMMVLGFGVLLVTKLRLAKEM